MLDVHLPGPVRLVPFGEARAVLVERAQGVSRRGPIAGSGGADRTGEVGDRVRECEWRLAALETGRFRPVAAFERLARGNRRQGEEARGRRRAGRRRAGIESGRDAANGIQHALRRRVLSALEVGVHQVVARVQFLGRRALTLRRGDGQQIRLDRRLPVAEARECVRRHVERVRLFGRDGRVSPGRVDRARRERRHVVAVDDVVREPRMVGMVRPEALEHRPGFQLIRVGLVGWVRREGQRQGIEIDASMSSG